MGSCYSTEKLLNDHSKSLNSNKSNRPRQRVLDPPVYSSSLRENFLNSARNLPRSRQKNFQPPSKLIESATFHDEKSQDLSMEILF